MNENKKIPLKVFIKTFGCQMNEHDSERMYGILSDHGYTFTHQEKEADLILINSCSIRQKAEQKAFSILGRYRALKAKNPRLHIGFCGCIAQREARSILCRAPFVDLIFGTKNIHRLPQLIEKMGKTHKPIIEVIDDDSGRFEQFLGKIRRENHIKAWATIMQGCDNYCTYCVVPYVRGREWSRSAGDIIAEIKTLALQGYKEVTLLGHNVNSYGKGQDCTFPELIQRIQPIPGIERIRFTTSHPKDLSEELIVTMKDCSKVCEHIHLPFQSGSDKILKRMRRHYSHNDYLKKVDFLRKIIPDIAITSDVIVGFPGEREEDFQQTLQLIETIQFEGLFTFLYSIRPQTTAGNFSEQVPNNIKQERFNILLQIQNQISSARNALLVNTKQEILAEEILREDKRTSSIEKLRGRTRSNKIVEFEGSSDLIGNLFEIEIRKANRFNLEGIIL